MALSLSAPKTPIIEFTTENTLGGSFMLTGAQRSGKTEFAKRLMFNIRNKISRPYCICPTNDSSHMYDGIFPVPMIYHDMYFKSAGMALLSTREIEARAVEFVRAILTDQTNKKNIADIVNDVDSLYALYKKIPPDYETEQFMSELKAKKAADPKFKEYLIDILKRGIVRGIRKFGDGLTEREKFILLNINVNPNALILFDDCADEYGRLKKVLTVLFTKPFHYNLTIIFISHGDTMIDPNIRRQPFYTVYCNQEIANNAHKNDYLSLMEDTKQRFKEAIQEIEPKKRFLVYDRMDNFGKKCVCMVEPKMVMEKFQMGSKDVRDYCDKIKKTQLYTFSR